MRNTFVYWMFDASGTCLYVGITRDPARRWSQHLRKPWISRVAYKRMSGPYEDAAARVIERLQQDELQPVYDMRQAMRRTRLKALHRMSNPAA